MKRVLTSLILCCVAGATLAAGSRRLAFEADDFAAGELEGVLLEVDGALHLSPLLARVQNVDAFYIWSLARDARGRLVAGTGDDGAILREQSGELKPWAQTFALDIPCLLQDGPRMLAGSSPDGIVYTIDDDGKAEPFADLQAQSVWDLARAGAAVFAASGPPARVFELREGVHAARPWAELPATNAMRLLAQGDRLWIGTEGPALVLCASGGDAASLRTLFEAPEQEIRQIVSAGEDAVYVLSLDVIAGDQGTSRSRITWLGANGESETFYSGEERLLAMAVDRAGNLVAADAGARQLLRVTREGKVVLYEFEQGDPISLRVEDDGEIVAGTGNLGSLLRLVPGEPATGRFVSEVIALDGVAQWGVVEAWPASSKLRFAARSGVRPEPDASWSEWSAALPMGSRPELPVAPYVQLRVEFERGAPPLSRLLLNYRERNLPPRIGELRVLAADAPMMLGSPGSSPGPLSQLLDDGLSVEFNVQSPPRQAEPDQAAWARGVRAIAWTSEDPNGDRLVHRVEIAPWPGSEWSLLADEVEMAPYAWDTRAWPDGSYRVRVHVSDAQDNALGADRESAATSATVQVDNTPPVIDSLRFEDGRLSAALHDDSSPLSSLSWRDDHGEWQALDVSDGVLDSKDERLDARLPGAAGRVRLRLVDAAGNARIAEIAAP